MRSMRIRIVQDPTSDSIDGLRLDRFEVGREYEVGTVVGSLLLAEGWAIPVVFPARGITPFPTTRPDRRRDPPNLIRERAPHPIVALDRAADHYRPRRCRAHASRTRRRSNK
jgi:hypothetical protein